MVYEGGTKVPSFFYVGGKIMEKSRYKNIFHSADILPTLLSAISDKDIAIRNIDGISHWKSITSNSYEGEAPRSFMVYNLDDELVPYIFNVENRTSKFQV